MVGPKKLVLTLRAISAQIGLIPKQWGWWEKHHSTLINFSFLLDNQIAETIYLPSFFLLFSSFSPFPNIVLKVCQISKNLYFYFFEEYLIRELTILEHINLIITFIKTLRGRFISIKLRRSLYNILFFFHLIRIGNYISPFFLINKKGKRTKEISHGPHGGLT